MENNLLSVIIFAPLAGAVINWLIGVRLKNEMFSGVVACGSIAISTIVAFYIAFVAGGGALDLDVDPGRQLPCGFRPRNGSPLRDLCLFCHIRWTTDPHLRDRVHARRQGVLQILRLSEPFHVFDADPYSR